MKKINILKKFEYQDDVERIQKVLAVYDYEATLSECAELWDMYSDSMAAGWMSLPDGDQEVLNCIIPYFN